MATLLYIDLTTIINRLNLKARPVFAGTHLNNYKPLF